MVERRVIDRNILINILSNMTYQYLSELQMKHLFIVNGYTLQIEEEGDDDAVQAD